jgi:hypothetical protein
MLGLLPEWLRDRIAGLLDRTIHASMAVTVAFTGMSLENLVLIIPALVSVCISILAWIAKRQDRKHRIAIYEQEEGKRTEAMLKHLESIRGQATAAQASQAISEASEIGIGMDNEKY